MSGRKRDRVEDSQASTSTASKLPRQSSSRHETTISQNVSEVGILESISMKNFMCHQWLSLDFGSNVNFIIGKNGSGKSAIMTAIVIGLGGKASSTSRGTNVKSFIKNQTNAAEITIKLRNRGPDCFKPELFGDKITIERKLVAEGAGSYKLKNDKGKVVSSKKEDINNMLDFFNIQLDNPISLLNQECSRSYLNSKNPTAKYKFFMRATQLEQLMEDYILTNAKKESAKQRLKLKEEDLKVMEAEVNENKRLYDHHLSLQGLRDKLRHLQKERVWAQIVSMEQKIAVCAADIEKRKEALAKLEKRLERETERERVLKEEYEVLKERITSSNNGINTMQGELDTARIAVQKAKEDQRRVLQSKRTQQVKLNSLKREYAELRKKIEDLEGREDLAVQRQRKQEEVQKLGERRDEIEDTIRTVDKGFQEKRAVVEKYTEERHKLEQEHRQIANRVTSEKRNLAEMKQGRANSMNRFGQFVPELLSRIDAAYARGQFQKKPIGPVGSYINLKDTAWTLAVETAIRGVLTSFLCDNQKDSRTLEAMMRDVVRARQIPSIIVTRFKQQVYDVARGKVVSNQYPTIYDVVKVDDPNVMNCLIDSCRLESILLFANSEEARNVMQHRPPQNCMQAYTKTGDQIMPSPSFRYYSCTNSNATLLKNNMEDTIKAMERDCAKLESEAQQLKMAIDRASRAAAEEEHESKVIQTQLMKLRDTLSQTRIKISEILNSDEGENADIAVFEEEERRSRHQMEVLERDLRNVDREEEECQRKVEELYAKYKELDTKLQSAMCNDTDKDKLVTCGKGVEEATGICRHFTGKVQQQMHALAEMAEAHTTKERDLKAMIASDVMGERFTPTHTVEECNQDIAKIEKRLQKENELSGGDRETMLKRYVESKTQYQKVRKQVSEMVKFLNTFDATMKERNTRYQYIRRQITTRVQYAFSSMLMCRGYQGSLNIDHDKQNLEINVMTSKSTIAASDVRTLSGGERSFSTVALVVSLWSATEAPFRMMDEFDIFMDLVNRQITMKMMLETAQEQSFRQFVFLTPLNMTSLESNDMIRIHHLKDPDRTQRTLPFRPVANQNGEAEEDE